MTEYWFARRFPVGDRRKSMAPMHWKGLAVVAVFMAAMLLGGIAFLWMAALGQFAHGLVAFVLAAALGAGWFITIAYAKGDHERTIADYRKDGSGA